MNTRQMRQVLEVCKCESFNKASQNLYISRSALLSSINSLEEELGQPLLIRSSSGITPTEFGKKFLIAARQVLAICDSLVAETPLTESDRFSVSSSHLKFVSAIFTRHFIAQNTNTNNFRYAEKDRKRVCLDVINKDSDLGIVCAPASARASTQAYFNKHNLEHYLICSNPTCCLVGPNNPLYYKESDEITAQELSPYRRLIIESPQLNEEAPQNSVSLYPCQGEIRISDFGNVNTFLQETTSFFIASYRQDTQKLMDYFPNIRPLHITDISNPYDVMWIKRKDQRVTPIMKRFLLSIYNAVDRAPHHCLL